MSEIIKLPSYPECLLNEGIHKRMKGTMVGVVYYKLLRLRKHISAIYL